jgi:hypothetical protein
MLIYSDQEIVRILLDRNRLRWFFLNNHFGLQRSRIVSIWLKILHKFSTEAYEQEN